MILNWQNRLENGKSEKRRLRAETGGTTKNGGLNRGPNFSTLRGVLAGLIAKAPSDLGCAEFSFIMGLDA